MASSVGNSPNPWAPYDSYRDCSLEICSSYCPQWCYIIFTPPPPFGIEYENDDENHDSSKDFSPLIIAVIGILASAFILLSYYTIIAKYCRRRRANGNRGIDTALDDNAHQTTAPDQSFEAPSAGAGAGLEDRLIKSIKVYKYKKGDGLVEGSDCSVCLSEFEENEGLRLLPKCNHAFHVPCIDTWLKSHSSCPLCRSNIAPYVNVNVNSVVPLPQQIPAHHQELSTVSAMEFQTRSNESVVVVVDDLELGFREEMVLGLDEPKTPTGGRLNDQTQDEITTSTRISADGGVQIQPLRRSVSLNCHTFGQQHHHRLLVADILGAGDGEEDEDLVIQIERELDELSFAGIGTSQEHHSNYKSNDRGGGVLSLVRSPLATKRSISTGRFMFTRYGNGKGKDSIIPN